MIAVIMAADDSKARMRDAIVLLNYGFGKCQKYQEDKVNKIPNVPVKHGVEKKVGARADGIIFLCRCDRCRFIYDKENSKIKRECDSTGQTGG